MEELSRERVSSPPERVTSPPSVLDLDHHSVVEIVSCMYLQENKFMCKDCSTTKKMCTASPNVITSSLKKNGGLNDQTIGDSALRFRICEWMCEVTTYYSYEREIVTIAISFFDRYKSITKEYQSEIDIDLVSVVALYLAVKLNGRRQRLIIKDFASLSGGRYSEEDIASGEGKLLSALSWCVYPPTSQAFARYFLHFSSSSTCPDQCDILLRVSHSIIEIAAFQAELIVEKASDIACASILIAIDGISSTISSDQIRELFADRLESIQFIIPERITLVRNRLESIMDRGCLGINTLHSMAQSMRLAQR